MALVNSIKTARKNSVVKFDRAKSMSEYRISALAATTKVERSAEEEKFDRDHPYLLKYCHSEEVIRIIIIIDCVISF
jgi:predicted metal-dependent peptidase